MTMTHGNSKWTCDVVKKMISLKAEGLSASQIAKENNDGQQ